MDLILTLVILLFSAIVHEVAHGLMAEKFGDDTAREAGRITLNPVPHIDPFGSILLPLFMWVATAGQFVFGAAKPVPVDFNQLRPARLGMAMVSVAGVLANLLLAILCVIPIKLGFANVISGPILEKAIVLNLLLAVFNLIPIPPLDGSKLVASFLPFRYIRYLFELERYGFLLVLIFLYTGLLNVIFSPVLYGFFRLFRLN